MGRHRDRVPEGLSSAGRGKGAQTPPPRPAPLLPGSTTKGLTDADHSSIIRTAQRRFAPTAIGILRNRDRHHFGISDRHRRNPQSAEGWVGNQVPTMPHIISEYNASICLRSGPPTSTAVSARVARRTLFSGTDGMREAEFGTARASWASPACDPNVWRRPFWALPDPHGLDRSVVRRLANQPRVSSWLFTISGIAPWQ